MTQSPGYVEQFTQVCPALHKACRYCGLGRPFVKACYFLEGDDPLAVDCYKTVERIQAGLHTEHIPNVRVIAQQLSGKAQGDPSHEAWVAHAKSCVQRGLDY